VSAIFPTGSLGETREVSVMEFGLKQTVSNKWQGKMSYLSYSKHHIKNDDKTKRHSILRIYKADTSDIVLLLTIISNMQLEG